MEDEENSLEKRAKDFFESRIHLNFAGINPVNIDSLEKHISVINYLLEKEYIMERGATVKDFNYCATSKGIEWFDKLRGLKY